MKIFYRVHEIWSGHESVTDRMTEGWTDEGHWYNPLSASRCGLMTSQLEMWPACGQHVGFRFLSFHGLVQVYEIG